MPLPLLGVGRSGLWRCRPSALIRSLSTTSQPAALTRIARIAIENSHIPQRVSTRSFMSMQERKLEKLEVAADESPTNPDKQAAYYKELNKLGCSDIVVQRIESREEYAVDKHVLQAYVEALARTGKEHLILERISHYLSRPDLAFSSPPSSSRDRTTKDLMEDVSSWLASPDKINAASSPSLSASHSKAAVAPALGSTPSKRSARRSSPPPPTRDDEASEAFDPEDAPEGSAYWSSGGKGNPMHVVVEESKGKAFFQAGRSIAVSIIYGFCLLTFLGLAMENSGLMKAGPVQAEFQPSEDGKVKFADVQGVDEAKAELQELVSFLRNPSQYTDVGGRMPKGILLTGPPGTGKTLLARAVAGEAGVPFFFMSGSEFDEMYVGVGAKRVRELFAAARAKAPSIIFIDELDAIGGKRNPRDQTYMKQTLNQLLVELDGFSQSEGVVVMAATNFPEMLDKALVRPGRFDRHVAVPLPDVRGRVQILRLHSKNVAMAPEVDLSIIARGTSGFSGADLQNLVNIAAIKASKDGARTVSLPQLEYAKDRIIMGAERRSAFVTAESKNCTAYHEGGHALVAMLTPGAIPLHKATIMPRGQSLGMTVQLPEMDKDSYSKREYLAMLDVCMGGRAAEELIFGDDNVTSGAHNDIIKATGMAKQMVTQFGMSEKVGPVAHNEDDLSQLSTKTKVMIEGEIQLFLETAHTRAVSILTEHRAELDRLAAALIEYETLTRAEMEAVVAGKPLDRPPIPVVHPAPIVPAVEA